MNAPRPDAIVRNKLYSLTPRERALVAVTVGKLIGIGGPVYEEPDARRALHLLVIADVIAGRKRVPS